MFIGGRWMHLKLSIIIPTYNRLELLKNTIQSILIQNNPNWELIVVDNNCTDGTREYVQGIMKDNHKVRHVKEIRQGLSYAKNAGAYNANNDIIAFIDDDEWADPEWVDQILKVFIENANVGCVGGRTILENKQDIPFWIPPNLYGCLGDWLLPYSSDRYHIVGRIGLGGGNMAIRRDIFNQVGGFDERLGRTGTILLADEDRIMSYKIYDAGYQLAYNPKAIAYHVLIKSRMTIQYFKRNARGMAYSRATKEKVFNYLFEFIYRVIRFPIALIYPKHFMHSLMRLYTAFYKLEGAIKLYIQ
jgi:glycosyltransferase involved in cell wall biosynthesis